MKISSIEFVKSVTHIRQQPKRRLPEIAFSGRSNVGKSSLINCLLNKKSVAKISSKPGKTRALNYFLINDAFYMVDLPGYGFAKVSKEEKAGWRELIETYFQSSEMLKGVVIITDIRHPLTALDLEMIQWIHHLQIPPIIVGTKADKLSGNKLTVQLKNNLQQIRNFLPDSTLQPFSAVNRTGRKELWQLIQHKIAGKI
jgi:GTP-binding protein